VFFHGLEFANRQFFVEFVVCLDSSDEVKSPATEYSLREKQITSNRTILTTSSCALAWLANFIQAGEQRRTWN
jgi:hypothetical protein